MKQNTFFILWLIASINIFASSFITDLTPDYKSDLAPIQNNSPGWYIYSGLNFTHLLQDSNYRFNDYQLYAGAAFNHDSFFLAAGWKGSVLDGLITIDGLDEVIEEGDRDITSVKFYNGFQFDFLSRYLNLSFYSLGENLFYQVEMESPEVYGFFISMGSERQAYTVLEADLVKNYSMNGVLSGLNLLPGLGWRSDLLTAQLKYLYSEISFSDTELSDNPIVLDLNCSSRYGFVASLDLKTSPVDLQASFRQIRYDIQLTGRTSSTQVLYIESETTDDGHIELLFREFDSKVSFLDDKLQFGGFYQSFHIPNEYKNRGLVDMDPLSPVGVLYRRKDIVEDFGLFYQQAGGSVGTGWQWSFIEVNGMLSISYLSVNMVGTYHYMDGLISFFPFPHWTDVMVYDDEDITTDIKYLIIHPELSFTFNLGRLFLITEISQLLPLYLNGGLEKGLESLGNLSRTGGLRASVLAGFRF